MRDDQLAMLYELMQIGFCVIEMALYLDTHPNDERAIGLHNTYAARYRELSETYNIKYEPLTFFGLSKCPWEYIESPWPWEIDYENIC